LKVSFSRSQWNNILTQINTSIANKPSGCPDVTQVSLLPPNTIWTRQHVLDAQEALKQSCPSITFEVLRPLWSQETIDEVMSKIGQMWCDCSNPGCPPEEADPVVADYYMAFAFWVIQCDDDPLPPPVELDIAFQVVEAGKHNRGWIIEGQILAPGEEIAGSDQSKWSPLGTESPTHPGYIVPTSTNYGANAGGSVGCDGVPKYIVEGVEQNAPTVVIETPICTWNCPTGTAQQANCISAVDGWGVAFKMRIFRSASGSPCCT
jgi:hypothetical protein